VSATSCKLQATSGSGHLKIISNKKSIRQLADAFLLPVIYRSLLLLAACS
jgi:hypothetical protein